jgi:hypothetical protein
MNLRFIRHMHSTPLLTTVYRQRATFTPYKDGRSEIVLREGDPPADLPILGATAKDGTVIWKNASNMIRRIRAAVIEDIEANKIPVALGEAARVSIERLAPDSVTPWWRDESKDAAKIARMVLTLETNPGARCCAGVEFATLQAGSLWWVQHRAMHCAQNFGTYPVISMIVDFAIEEGE